MAYSPWSHLGRLAHIKLVWECLEEDLSLYRHDKLEIVLDPRYPPRHLRSSLAHEIVHAERGDVPTGDHVMDARQELIVNKEAARRLISIRALADVLAWTDCVVQAAEELRVDVDTLRTRLAHLHPAERHHLSRQMEGCEPAEN